MKYSRKIGLVLLILIFALNFVSCGNDDGNSASKNPNPVSITISATAGGSITSSNGKLTLDFPAGAVTADTLVTITEISPDDLPPEFDIVDSDIAYQLEPEGITFGQPVIVSVILDGSPVQEDGSMIADSGLLLTSTDGNLEALENLQLVADADANSLVVSGELSHFSYLSHSIVIPFVIGYIRGVPDSHPADGSTFDIEVEIKIYDKHNLDYSFSYWDTSYSPIIFAIINELQVPGPTVQTYGCDNVGKGHFRVSIYMTAKGSSPLLDKIEYEKSMFFYKQVNCVGTNEPPPGTTPPSESPTPTPTPTGTPPSVAPPPTPTGVSADGSKSCQITVKWDSMSGADYFIVERMTVGTSGTKDFRVDDPKATSYTNAYADDNSLSLGKEYCYRVKACNAGGCSVVSNYSCATKQ